jgi:DNA-binding Lrp family transcriptional regulator
MKAYVMIRVRPGSVAEVVRNLRAVKGVTEANMTFGPYDAVAVVQAADINKLGPMVANELQPIPGVIETLTCLVVEP